ncbi:DNA polymerase III polC-type [Metamycoplasma cloacale]|uniref:DNA polymerase III PolC-type n=1 Tax=Metamycoplasma cloacale TaxID=92401 RepID=A0A2Z4LMS8_9BACT|nr:PolC-type DNA polymerase III [Metamycoplasma cloacale]AWX42547.1 PolC-type DNA polymerase III [Metamycoplasma cloacale]VEU79776.1 DNA polymerase III polC-type [Metamycoplasma cloacale]
MASEYRQSLLKLAKNLNFELDSEWKDVEVAFVLDSETKTYHMQFTLDNLISFHKFDAFKKTIEKKLGKPIECQLEVRSSIRDKGLILDYLIYLLQKYRHPLCKFRSFLTKDNVELTETEFILTINIKEVFDQFLKYRDDIQTLLEQLGYSFYTVNLKLNESKANKRSTIENIVKNFDTLKINRKEVELENTNTHRRFNNNNNKGKAIEMSISDALLSYEPLVSLKGEIFKTDVRNLKNNNLLYTVGISDYKEAIMLKMFVSSEAEQPNFVIGKTIVVTGRLVDDQYSGKKMLEVRKVSDIIFTEDLQQLSNDNEEEKRIELAARTHMSTQDGISTPKEYLKAAEHYGHEAIAIVDYEGVQGFPEFYNTAKKNKKVKPIFGVTLNAIDSRNNFFLNFRNQDFELANETYVVFDIETTGLSARFNEIIEFGAVVIQNGAIIEKQQFFLKPSKPIPAKIVELTKIDDNIVNEFGIEYNEGVQRIYNILKDKISVAHNANFDIGVCKENFKKLGLDTSRITAIDTLAVAHYLFPEFYKFKLGTVAKKFNVLYDSEIAHRADYDAEILAKVWKAMILKLSRQNNINTSIELNDVYDEQMFNKKMSYEIRILAKNQSGLKKMFKHISTALTNQYYGHAILFLDKLKTDPDIYIGSSTHRSYLWDKVIYGDTESIDKAIAPYDYIELPPISTFNYLLYDESLTEENIKFAYKDLIKRAKEQNKILVAVSDSRFVYDYQKLIHSIYMVAPQLGNTQHWLHKYVRHNPPVFKYLTTKEMLDEFSFLNDANLIKEIVIKNPKMISDSIDSNIEVIKNKLYVPTFDDSANKLRDLVYKNAHQRYGQNIDPIIQARIEKELNPIIKYGYSVIYWISHKLVKKSNDDGYLVGSRGSVGSSIVANLANISEVNPLDPHWLCNQCKYLEWNKDKNFHSGWDLPDKICPNCQTIMIKDGHSIPFETFLGFEANKVPDIDLNFSGEYQPIIHNYTKELFGDSHTLRAGTISTVASKTAYGFCQGFDEKIHPIGSRLGWSKTFLDFLSTKTEGVKRTTGQHPGGIIIIPTEFEVEDFTPINYPANDTKSSWKTTHFDFTSIHDNVLKLDLLGHDDPTVIKMLEELTNTNAIKDIPKTDDNVLKLFSTTESLGIDPSQISGETTGAYGLPEFGTQFVRRMLKTAQPKSFNDLILMSGLSHGTDVWNNNAEELIKSGKSINECVCCRDDIMLNLMAWEVDSIDAFNIMEKVRKGKGLTEDEEKLLTSKQVPSWYIESLKKIKYMFPKAHATAYVIMAWRIAWYKLYYPLAFYASYYSTRPDAIDIKVMSGGKSVVTAKLNELKNKMTQNLEMTTKEKDLIPMLEITQELYARGLMIKNIDLLKSKATQWIVDEEHKALIPPLAVVDGLGATVAETIVKAREESPFLSIEDLMERTKLNSRLLNELRNLGVIDNLEETNQNELF